MNRTVDHSNMYCRQAIVTRYHGPTDTRGSRVSARCAAGRVTVPWDHALDVPGNHAAAVAALVRKLGWNAPPCGPFELGALPGGGYVAVMACDGSRVAVEGSTT